MKLKANYFKKSLIGSTLGAALVLSAIAAPAPAQARVALAEEEHINSSLLSAKIGLIIQSRCSTISPRLFLAIKKARALRQYGLDLGYTAGEMKAYVTGNAEKKRFRKAAHAYLEAHGANKKDKQTYCAVGREEIAKGTLTGQLLSGS
jgi:hypothetical protein